MQRDEPQRRARRGALIVVALCLGGCATATVWAPEPPRVIPAERSYEIQSAWLRPASGGLLLQLRRRGEGDIGQETLELSMRLKNAAESPELEAELAHSRSVLLITEQRRMESSAAAVSSGMEPGLSESHEGGGVAVVSSECSTQPAEVASLDSSVACERAVGAFAPRTKERMPDYQLTTLSGRSFALASLEARSEGLRFDRVEGMFSEAPQPSGWQGLGPQDGRLLRLRAEMKLQEQSGPDDLVLIRRVSLTIPAFLVDVATLPLQGVVVIFRAF